MAFFMMMLEANNTSYSSKVLGPANSPLPSERHANPLYSQASPGHLCRVTDSEIFTGTFQQRQEILLNVWSRFCLLLPPVDVVVLLEVEETGRQMN
jgi:hypothetical protein